MRGSAYQGALTLSGRERPRPNGSTRSSRPCRPTSARPSSTCARRSPRPRPRREEAISYGAPAFRYHGKPLWPTRASKAHCSLFPMGPELIDRHRDDLEDFIAAKGTFHFTPDHPIPDAAIAILVRERMAIIDGG